MVLEIESRNALFKYGENMEKIKRPKKVNRGENVYLTNERFQDYVKNQFNLIFDKLDEIVEEINK